MSFATPSLDELVELWWSTYNRALGELGVDESKQWTYAFDDPNHRLAGKTADKAVRRLCRLSDDEWRAFRNELWRPHRGERAGAIREDRSPRRGSRHLTKIQRASSSSPT